MSVPLLYKFCNISKHAFSPATATKNPWYLTNINTGYRLQRDFSGYRCLRRPPWIERATLPVRWKFEKKTPRIVPQSGNRLLPERAIDNIKVNFYFHESIAWKCRFSSKFAQQGNHQDIFFIEHAACSKLKFERTKIFYSRLPRRYQRECFLNKKNLCDIHIKVNVNVNVEWINIK